MKKETEGHRRRWVCRKCGRLLGKVNVNATVGFISRNCYDSRCKARNPIYILNGKILLINDRLLKKRWFRNYMDKLTPGERKVIISEKVVE